MKVRSIVRRALLWLKGASRKLLSGARPKVSTSKLGVVAGLDELRGWMKDELFRETSELVFKRMVWDRYQAILDGAPEDVRSNVWSFHRWATRNYVDAVTSSVRRSIDPAKDVVSLRRVLTELVMMAEGVTRDLYMSRFPDEGELELEQSAITWELFAVKDLSHLDVSKVEKDRQALMRKCSTVKKYVDKRVAHLAIDASPPGATFGVLNAGIGTVVDVYSRYFRLLTGSMVTLEGAYLGPWEYAFEFPWISPAPPAN